MGCILLGISCIAAVNSVVSVLTIIGGDMSQKDTAVNMEGLPPFITLEMVEALLEMQETYGHPASSGLAQIICESGFGSYGPGGEEGHGLSGLAYDCKNLFGIKYWSGDQFASGNHSYTTGEQNPDGSWNTQSASFSVYKNYSDCIKQRAWMLERDPYVSHITPYKNSGNGRYTIEQANNFVSGIRAGGWATSLSYEEHCNPCNNYLICFCVEIYLCYVNHIFVEGLEAYLIVILESNQEETLSTVLKEGYQFFIGLSENELWKKAYQNLCEDTCLQGMTQIMNEFMGVPVLDEEEGMFVISNKSRFKGASAILNRQVLEDFANRRKVNRIFVLPSSIHECILVLDNGDLTLEELSCMVTQVNASEVAPEEQLPNRAYVLEF